MFKLFNFYSKNYLLIKGLSKRSIEAYSSDVLQFCACCDNEEHEIIINNPKYNLKKFFDIISSEYAPKTVRRKMISVKTFLDFLYSADILKNRDYTDFKFKIQNSQKIPKFIPRSDIGKMVHHYENLISKTKNQTTLKELLRRGAIFEFLYLTGVRVEELCNLKMQDVYFEDEVIIINGKGKKQRLIPFMIKKTKFLKIYYEIYKDVLESCNYFFINKWNHKISTQSVRSVITRLEEEIKLEYSITPHMFRHTLATNLLENGVNLRIVQEILGHSTIKTTEIYTHITIKHAKEVFLEKHPYNYIH